MLELAKHERLDDSSFDLPGARRAYQEISILEQEVMLLAKRGSGQFLQIDPYFLFQQSIEFIGTEELEDKTFKRESIIQAKKLL